MTDLYANPNFIRALFSMTGLFGFWGLALLFPYRQSANLKSTRRWLTNLIFSFGNGLLILLILPLSLIEISQSSSAKKWSFLSLEALPFYLKVLIGIILLDIVIYWQHRLTHKIPLFWRLHRHHHSDIEIDTTTAGRFHPIEIFLSFFIKAFFIILFKLPALAIIIFEILLNFSSLFNHSNFQLPEKVEKIFKYFLITPALHRVHHSTIIEEQNSNFGFSVSFWDRLFASYREQSKSDPQTMEIGLKKFRDSSEQSLLSLLLQPLKKIKAPEKPDQ